MSGLSLREEVLELLLLSNRNSCWPSPTISVLALWYTSSGLILDQEDAVNLATLLMFAGRYLVKPFPYRMSPYPVLILDPTRVPTA